MKDWNYIENKYGMTQSQIDTIMDDEVMRKDFFESIEEDLQGIKERMESFCNIPDCEFSYGVKTRMGMILGLIPDSGDSFRDEVCDVKIGTGVSMTIKRENK